MRLVRWSRFAAVGVAMSILTLLDVHAGALKDNSFTDVAKSPAVTVP